MATHIFLFDHPLRSYGGRDGAHTHKRSEISLLHESMYVLSPRIYTGRVILLYLTPRAIKKINPYDFLTLHCSSPWVMVTSSVMIMTQA